ncbi:MAG: hypothetical protein GX982_01730 [Tissierellia bacterium]|nr:hypothetical protein [Tissierellia bacterium]
MNSIGALTLVCAIFAIGDIVSIKTKSMISTMLVALLLLLIGFWTKIPTTLFEDAGLLKIGGILIPFLIVHMGTLLNLSDLKKEWRTVIIAIGAVIGIAIFLLLLGIPLLGREFAISAAPPISGGVVAAIIMGEKAESLGMDNIYLFATLLVVVQQFFGIPLASFLLNKEARKVLKTSDEKINIEKKLNESKVESNKKISSAYDTPYILLAKVGLVVFLSTKFAEITKLNIYVVSLFFGLLFKELGFLQEDILKKANAFGLGMLALMAVIFNSTSMATPETLKGLLFPLIGSLVIATIGILIVSAIIGKILNYSMAMSMAIGLSALFGFPGTFVISNEVANAVGETEEERLLILDHILPKMLVSGFVTVTIASVVLAGVMVNML